MFTMKIFGISIILILGINNFLFLLFQLLSGLHIIKVKTKVHRTTGIILVISAFLHGSLAFLANL